MKTYKFNYIVDFKITDDNLEIIGYNSPYNSNVDQAEKDLRFAIVDQKVIDVASLKKDIKYSAEIECLFIKNYNEETYDQLFSLKTLVGSSDPVG